MAPPGVFPPTLRPFQFSSLGHLDARANEVVARVANIEHLRTSTVEWMRRGYLSFRAFLLTANAAEAFLSGDFYRQEETLTQWRAWLLTRGVGRVSVRTYWGAVKAICSRIEAQDGMASPLRWIAPPRVGRVLPKSLTRDAARTVLEFVQNYEWRSPFVARRNSAIVGSMLLAGLRCGEVLRLCSDDVDGQQGTFRIREGKGRDGGKDRTAYMSPQLKELISHTARRVYG
jgi:integrase